MKYIFIAALGHRFCTVRTAAVIKLVSTEVFSFWGYKLGK
jgi:hypothetical protein